MAYSHSQLKVFADCPLRFRLKYIDKVPEPDIPTSPALKFGSIIHSVMEELYKKIQNSGTAPSKEYLKEYFTQEMKNFRTHYETTAWETFPDKDFDDRISLGEQIIDWYYDTYFPFNDASTNGLEQMINFTLPNGAKFRGIIDRLAIKNGEAQIIDYKTDKSIAPLQDFEKSYQQQLTSYAIWVKQHYPHIIKKVTGKLIYLRLQEEITREITEEMLNQAITTITEAITQIEETIFRYNMGEKDAFWPIESPACRWCAYQAMCPLWKHKFTDDEVVITTEIGQTTIKKLVDKFYHLTNQKKELEEQLTSIKEFLEEYVVQHKDQEWKNLYGEQGQVRVDYKTEYKAQNEHNETMKDILLDEDLKELLIMSINSKKLTKYLKDHPEQLNKRANLLILQDKITIGRAKEKKETK